MIQYLTGERMRKFIVIVIIILLSLPLAARDFGFIGINAGYSSRSDAALIGFNGTYSYLPDVSRNVSIGFGTHTDFAIGISKPDDIPLFIGSVFGLAMEFRINDMMAFDIILGPCIVAEADENNTAVGLGPGLDAAFTLGFGKNSIAGFALGTTLYPNFSLLSESRDSFGLSVMGYAGVTFRFPATAIVIPVVAYLLD